MGETHAKAQEMQTRYPIFGNGQANLFGSNKTARTANRGFVVTPHERHPMTAELPADRLIVGNCVEVMRGFPEESIDLTVTSPPYDQLRDYKGYEFDAQGIASQ